MYSKRKWFFWFLKHGHSIKKAWKMAKLTYQYHFDKKRKEDELDIFINGIDEPKKKQPYSD